MSHKNTLAAFLQGKCPITTSWLLSPSALRLTGNYLGCGCPWVREHRKGAILLILMCFSCQFSVPLQGFIVAGVCRCRAGGSQLPPGAERELWGRFWGGMSPPGPRSMCSGGGGRAPAGGEAPPLAASPAPPRARTRARRSGTAAAAAFYLIWSWQRSRPPR